MTHPSQQVAMRRGLRTQVRQILERIGDTPDAYGITGDELEFLKTMRARNIVFGTRHQSEVGQRIYDKVFNNQEAA